MNLCGHTVITDISPDIYQVNFEDNVQLIVLYSEIKKKQYYALAMWKDLNTKEGQHSGCDNIL